MKTDAIVCITGASGRMGQAQVRELVQQGLTPRVMSRNWKATEEALTRVDAVAADFGDVESLVSAFTGVDAILNNLPALAGARAEEYARNFVTAAKAAGVRRIIHNTTMWAPDAPCGEPFYDTGLALENIVADPALDVTIFRPVLFMDNLLTLFQKPDIVERGIYRYCQKPGMLATWISMADLAKFMVTALDRDDLIGRRFVVGGPEVLPIEEVVSILSDTLGRPVTYQYEEPYGLFADMHGVLGLGDDFPKEAYAGAMANFYNFNNDSPYRPFIAAMDSVLAEMPIKLTPMREWAAQQDWSTDLDSRNITGSRSG